MVGNPDGITDLSILKVVPDGLVSESFLAKQACARMFGLFS